MSIIASENSLMSEIEQNRILTSQTMISSLKKEEKVAENLFEVEFKVFSQWGEDGIIQYLISRIEIPNKVFIEFGVSDYLESNTRFLLVNNNWSGLVMDGSESNICKIKQMELYWRYTLQAVQAFITVENIACLLKQSNISGDIGILSVDVDGNDYWVWQAISEEIISPRIVIVEYNSIFGKDRALTVPYSADFQRTQAHYSNLYYGASLRALCLLAKEKGYEFVGSNSAGNNAFFVRSDVVGKLNIVTVEQGYVESRIRESRNQQGQLTFLSGNDRFIAIQNLPIVDVETGLTMVLKDCLA
ncbi:MAG: hypothetical protein CVU44_14570 [Chloroflexi bacterium HGW-Chloroflexi-6]|nr:MAG: hypothetical protein CVU44_14570 [Chloroflexi bacterium HGW-Chloroflexi-6]